LAVWLVADFEALSYQVTTTFATSCAARIRTAPAINYTACCMLGYIHYQLVINLLQSKIHSIEALPFPKKLVFRVGKKALADSQALLQFLDVSWLVGIAIVLGCVGCHSNFIFTATAPL
jgi:hypothetical protein